MKEIIFKYSIIEGIHPQGYRLLANLAHFLKIFHKQPIVFLRRIVHLNFLRIQPRHFPRLAPGTGQVRVIDEKRKLRQVPVFHPLGKSGIIWYLAFLRAKCVYS